MGKNVTMKDIAAAVGVSTVTVSKALSDKEGVSDEVREKIKQKAEMMGYRYNSLARSMKEGSSYNIGVLVAERYFDDNAFYNNLYTKIVMELNRTDYSAILEILPAKDEKEGILPNCLANNKVDGLIIMGQLKRQYINTIKKEGIPYIFLDFYDEEYATDAVVSDSVYGSYLLTNYLVKNGHKRIGFVGSVHATSSILDRYLGYYKAVIENELEYSPEWIIEDRDEDGKFIDLTLPKEMPTAFVCNCDEVAYLLVEKLKKKGYRIPEDISIVGFDDYIFATFCNPQLTTFRVSLEAMSETVVDAMKRKIKQEEYSIKRKVISGNLVIRNSVKEVYR